MENKLKGIASKLLLLAVLALAATACKKDDEGPANNLTVDGKTTVITKGLMIYDPTVNSTASRKDGLSEYYRNELILYNGLTISSEGVASGTGDFIDFQYVGSNQSIEEGTYTFTGEEANYDKLNIWSAEVDLGYNATTEEATSVLDITQGTVVVTKSGNNYTVKVDAKAGDKVIKATYTGTITLMEENL